MKTTENNVNVVTLRKAMKEVAEEEGKQKIENLGIIIVPNTPLTKKRMERNEYAKKVWNDAVIKIERQLGISVLEDDALVEVRVFDADHRDKDTNLQDHWDEWGVQTDWKDNYKFMSRYLPLSLLKNYKQGDVIRIKASSGVDLEMKCLVKYLSVAKTWEETLEKIA